MDKVETTVHTVMLFWKSVDWKRTSTLKAFTPAPPAPKAVVVTWPGTPFVIQGATKVMVPDGKPLVQPIVNSQGENGVGLALMELTIS